MRSVEAAAVFPVPPEQAWDFIFGDEGRRAVELSRMIVAFEGYQMRPDGTPRYTLVTRMGPFRLQGTSDYFQFERPHHTANRILDSPFGGTFSMTFEPVPDGTRVRERWEVETHNRLAGLLLPLAHPVLRWSLQRDLDAWAVGAAHIRR